MWPWNLIKICITYGHHCNLSLPMTTLHINNKAATLCATRCILPARPHGLSAGHPLQASPRDGLLPDLPVPTGRSKLARAICCNNDTACMTAHCTSMRMRAVLWGRGRTTTGQCVVFMLVRANSQLHAKHLIPSSASYVHLVVSCPCSFRFVQLGMSMRRHIIKPRMRILYRALLQTLQVYIYILAKLDEASRIAGQ